MATDPKQSIDANENQAHTGNASNPSPHDESAGANQHLGERAEKYLREVASIEDVPDAQDQEEMDRVLKENSNEDQ
jgi:hypothetical protein